MQSRWPKVVKVFPQIFTTRINFWVRTETLGWNSIYSSLPVPSCSRWWQRWTSNCASCTDTPKEGTNQGAKQESTRVQAASTIGDTNWSQGSWDPQSLSELEGENIDSIKQPAVLSIKEDERNKIHTHFKNSVRPTYKSISRQTPGLFGNLEWRRQ